MKYYFATHADAVLVEGAPFDDFGLQAVVQFRHEFECQCL